ncbi:MAG: DUF3426 domain-containing protein [Proteobacteria bacterium]|nr:DUF3426 domain-containing protein [Pseudomonadota bacterium]
MRVGSGPRERLGFVQRARDAHHWRHPAVRAVLLALLLLLVLLLAWQAAWHWRNLLAARSPQAAQVLSAACRQFGCTLEAPRALDALVLDSSQLARTPDPQVLRLSLEVRNSASYPVRTPALELTFTDADGRTLVRRVLQPAETDLAAPAALAAGATWRVDRPLAVGRQAVAGFAVELFYP